ncbi:MAG: hypothetical protein QOF41_3143 [Methylobacteriaceae bacterium]|nr:hypothetical protein [Methylobacteriaceae bacterium]
MRASRCCLALVALLAGSSALRAANWQLGHVLCRDRAGNVHNINYCHNCAQAVGAGPYVSWTFVANCDGRATARRARGSLSCAGNYGNESTQKATIRADAQAQLPVPTVACPVAPRRR